MALTSELACITLALVIKVVREAEMRLRKLLLPSAELKASHDQDVK